MSRLTSRHGLFIVAFLAWAEISLAATIFVRGDAAPGGDGTSWESAFASIEEAMLQAKGGDAIWVSAGTYTPMGPAGDRAISFALQSGVALYGGFSGDEIVLEDRDPSANPTILSGDLNGDDSADFVNYSDNSHHVITGNGVDSSAVLDGFTIRGGNANGAGAAQNGGGLYMEGGSPTIRNCTFVENACIASGGAIYAAYGGSAWIEQCTLKDNWANNGGGVYNLAGADSSMVACTFDSNTALAGGAIRNYESDAWIEGCVFVNNDALFGGAIRNYQGTVTITGNIFVANVAGNGGAVFSDDSLVSIADCSFESNQAYEFLGGGAIYDEATTLVIEDSTFTMNSAGEQAGGALSNNGSLHMVNRSLFDRNTATDGGASSVFGCSRFFNCSFFKNEADYAGGAVIIDQADPWFVNCVFTGNVAYVGAGVYNDANDIVNALNTTFWGNVAAYEGGAWWNGSGESTIANCIFWNNTAGGNSNQDAQFLKDGGDVTFQFNCLQGWSGSLGGVGNFSADPQFVDPDGADDVQGTLDDDVRVSTGSPCIDSGRNANLLADLNDIDSDGDIVEPVPLDLDDLTRRFDDPGSEDTGSGVGAIVDLGAYEYQSIQCAGDANADGVIDPLDVGFVLSRLGCDVNSGDTSCDSADQNHDGLVDPLDSGFVLSRLGTCE